MTGPNHSHIYSLAAFVLGALLASCTRGESPDKAAPASPFIAMARGEVDVEGGLLRVRAPRDGRVEEVRVADGARVGKGDILAAIDTRQAHIAVDIAEAGLAEAEARVAVLKARLPQAASHARRVGDAADAGAAPGQSADESAAAVTVLRAEVRAAEAAVMTARAQVAQARSEVDVRTLKAPVAGRVVRLSLHVGDLVSAQSPNELFQILPDGPLIVRAELNEAYVDKIKSGMQAEVVRDSDQGPASPARVIRIGDVFGPSRLTDDPVERAGAHDVECVLAIDGGDFRVGQRVLVRFRR